MLSEGNTIPFIARYRKETTGALDEDKIKDIEEVYRYEENLLKRKEDVIRLIDEKGLLTDELKDEIMKSTKLVEVEDLYRPLKGLTKKITKDDKTNPWYMAISETGEDIKYTINLTTKEGYINTTDGQNKSNGVITGTISMARNKSYSMTITPEYQASPTEGKLKIKITIKSETEDKPITYDVPITWI